ncbi:unnamed protein product, partial [Phaeothamnion confervicola]
LQELARGPLTGRRLRSADDCSPSTTSMTRRAFLASSVAASSLTLDPRHVLAHNSAPCFTADDDRFTVAWGDEHWTLDRKAFDGVGALDVTRTSEGYRGSLRRATFAAT